jgi:anti-sigma regulatory factor (Ser/Thr protein kinase)
MWVKNPMISKMTPRTIIELPSLPRATHGNQAEVCDCGVPSDGRIQTLPTDLTGDGGLERFLARRRVWCGGIAGTLLSPIATARQRPREDLVRALRLHLPGHAGSPGEARRQLRAWLARRQWPREEASDIVLAVDEAVANAVEHAYSRVGSTDQPAYPSVELCVADLNGANRTRRVLITVTDRGRWQTPSPSPGHRGRGLALMRLLTDSLELTTGTAGTTVKMVSSAVASTTTGAARAASRLRDAGTLLLLTRLAPGSCCRGAPVGDGFSQAMAGSTRITMSFPTMPSARPTLHPSRVWRVEGNSVFVRT